MDNYRDQTYLLKNQYKDATNFGARVDLHRRFSVNTYGFHRWVFDHFTLEEGSIVTQAHLTPEVRIEERASRHGGAVGQIK